MTKVVSVAMKLSCPSTTGQKPGCRKSVALRPRKPSSTLAAEVGKGQDGNAQNNAWDHQWGQHQHVEEILAHKLFTFKQESIDGTKISASKVTQDATLRLEIIALTMRLSPKTPS